MNSSSESVIFEGNQEGRLSRASSASTELFDDEDAVMDVDDDMEADRDEVIGVDENLQSLAYPLILSDNSNRDIPALSVERANEFMETLHNDIRICEFMYRLHGSRPGGPSSVEEPPVASNHQTRGSSGPSNFIQGQHSSVDRLAVSNIPSIAEVPRNLYTQNPSVGTVDATHQVLSTSQPPSTSVTAQNNAISSNLSCDQIDIRTSSTAPSGMKKADEKRRDSLNDFKLPVVKQLEEDTDSDDDSQTCSICYEPWSNSGSHRLSSLKCGHVFGQSCIEKWLKGGQKGKCPHCNAKAKKSDIRVIYAKALKAIDTSERDKALKDLEKEKELRRKMEIEKAQVILKYQMAVEEVNRMKAQVKHQSLPNHSSKPGPSKQQATANLPGSYVYEKTVNASIEGGCRVLAYDYANCGLIASVPSPNQLLFSGFGVKKISALMNWKTNQYVPIHSKPIRGMAFNGRNDGLLLTGSMDKTIKITSLSSNTVVQVYNANAPVWSCCWNVEDINYLLAGLSNGTIVVYDTRNTSEEVLILNREGSKHPIVAMNYIPRFVESNFPCSGLLVGTLNNCLFWEQKSPLDFKPHILPLEGNCISLSFEPRTRHCLASFRPNKTYNAMRHVMCELLYTKRVTQTEPEFKCNPIQSFFGGSTVKLLARSAIFRRPNSNDRLLIAAGDEGSSSLDLWDSSSGAKAQHLMAGATILDVCPFQFQGVDYLAALSDKMVKLYKWQE